MPRRAASLLLLLVRFRTWQLRLKARQKALKLARVVAPYCLANLGRDWDGAPREVEEAWQGLERLALENPGDRLIRELCWTPWMALGGHWTCPPQG